MYPADFKELTRTAREKAFHLGFDLFGIAPAAKLNEHEYYLKDWLSSGMNGNMSFLERNIEKRLDPELLFPGAKSIIVTGINYYNEQRQGHNGIPVISRYAYGNDYHDVILNKLQQVLQILREKEPSVNCKVYVDSAPILEKAWARQAGLGWQGRNSLIINSRFGSFFFLGILIVDTELEFDKPFEADHCGECRLCVDACPTGAITGRGTIDARKCISYLTVENKDSIPLEFSEKFGGRIFGCDICQEVCPWNKNARNNTNPEFRLSHSIESMTKKEWFSLTGDRFDELFKASPVARIRYERMIRNIEAAFPQQNKKADH